MLYNTQYFYIADSDMYANNTHIMYCCVSTATMVIRTRHNVTLYVYCLSLSKEVRLTWQNLARSLQNSLQIICLQCPPSKRLPAVLKGHLSCETGANVRWRVAHIIMYFILHCISNTNKYIMFNNLVNATIMRIQNKHSLWHSALPS